MLFSFLPGFLFAQSRSHDKPASKPIFKDPVYDGAADPTVIWNQKEQKWVILTVWQMSKGSMV